MWSTVNVQTGAASDYKICWWHNAFVKNICIDLLKVTHTGGVMLMLNFIMLVCLSSHFTLSCVITFNLWWNMSFLMGGAVDLLLNSVKTQLVFFFFWWDDFKYYHFLSIGLSLQALYAHVMLMLWFHSTYLNRMWMTTHYLINSMLHLIRAQICSYKIIKLYWSAGDLHATVKWGIYIYVYLYLVLQY